MAGGSTLTENSPEITATTTSLGRNGAEAEFEGNTEASLEGRGRAASGCSSCFGRVIASTKRLPSDGSMLSGHGLRCKKNRRCLRKLSCISSCDVLPSVTSSTTAPFDKHRAAHNVRRRNEAGVLRNSKNALMSNAGSVVHRNLQRGLGGLLCENRGAANVDQSSAGSQRDSPLSFRAGNWCLMRPTVIKADAIVSNNPLSRVNSALQASNGDHSRGDQGTSRTSSDSCETTSIASVSNGEVASQRLLENINGRLGVYGRETGAMDGDDRRNTTGLWIDSALSSSTPRSLMRDRLNSSSSVFSGTSSASRAIRVPFVFGMSHRTRSLEVISSPSSYMSSPDVHLSNSDMLRSYASTLQSPNVSRATSSPEYQEGYHVQSSSETPVFRSFRQFPLQPFEENQECVTYGGLSEQVFMWEANLILGGIPSDHYRDLRLDIDSMSYEDLLALEESMGNVCTGLEKDMISRCLRSKVYSVNNAINPTQEDSEIKCSICQVDFEEGSELGILKCGHNHHFLCIEEWLLRKNQCPICKASASVRSGT